mmetsp:Transcript_45548/g.60436  ORF Transcript_45548/g.60436 Transcript_45548/m.60436 type:complete len:80 (+) Transcript_45548:399-638(+)
MTLMPKQPDMKKNDSVPFSISLAPLDSDSGKLKRLDSTESAHFAKMFVEKTIKMKTGSFLNLNQSIGKCDHLIETLKEK